MNMPRSVRCRVSADLRLVRPMLCGLVLGTLVACAPVGPAPASGGATVEPQPSGAASGQAGAFSLAYDQPHDTGYGVAADAFDQKLQELSSGTMKINQFPLGQLGQEPEEAQKVRTGDIDFVFNSTANVATVVPQAGVFSLHYIFRDNDHLLKSVTDAHINDTFKKMIVDGTTGAHSLGLMTLGLRNMYSKAPIKGIDDVRGKKVRVQATPTEDAFFSAYGATPVHMPFGQVYTSLQTGVVQIAENGNDIYFKNKHYEVAAVISATQHEANINHLWVSDKLWNALTEQQKQWVQQSADYALPLAAQKSLELDSQALDSLKALGVQYFADVDKASLMALAQPIQDDQAKQLGPFAQQLLQQVRDIR